MGLRALERRVPVPRAGRLGPRGLRRASIKSCRLSWSPPPAGWPRLPCLERLLPPPDTAARLRPCRSPEQPQPEIKQLGRYVQVSPWGGGMRRALLRSQGLGRRVPPAPGARRTAVGLVAPPRVPRPLSPCRAAQLGILGSGTYGLVIRARDTSDPDAQDVAIKLLPRGGFVSRSPGLQWRGGWRRQGPEWAPRACCCAASASLRAAAAACAVPVPCAGPVRLCPDPVRQYRHRGYVPARGPPSAPCPARPTALTAPFLHRHCLFQQVKEYRRYVMREVMHHGGLKHPFIIDLKVRLSKSVGKGNSLAEGELGKKGKRGVTHRSRCGSWAQRRAAGRTRG